METDADLLPDLSELGEEDPSYHIFCVNCFPDDNKPRISYCGKMHQPRNVYKGPKERWRKDGPLPSGIKFCGDCVKIRPNCMKCKGKK